MADYEIVITVNGEDTPVGSGTLQECQALASRHLALLCLHPDDLDGVVVDEIAVHINRVI